LPHTPEIAKIAVATLGCKVNQCDSASLIGQFQEAGFTIVPFTTFADVYVINTCTVTGFSDFQARQLIRRALRANPQAKIAVTGCYAQTQPEALASVKGVSCVIGNDQKHRIAELLQSPPSDGQKIFVDDIFSQDFFLAAPPPRLSSRTRAFFKIQDGCNAFCSYCIVPFARGKSRSLPVVETLTGARRFAQNGYREVVLTGIHLGQYGCDLHPKTTLVSVLEQILLQNPEVRIRLSSIEPHEISEDLLRLFLKYPNLCRHLHIPLQSGDDTILKRMKRAYNTDDYRSLIQKIVASIADIAIGIDVMTGFPSETDTHFRNTLSLLNDLPVAYLHVFPYSERPGTAALDIHPKVPDKIKKERAALLRSLSCRKREAFARQYLGKILSVLVENAKDKKTGRLKGFSSNYLPVILDKSIHSLVNTVVNVRIDDYIDGKLTGEVIHG
jgi:threonylcarbamoyladenosine tRNA methylthiotransferase MtaB